MKVLDLFSGIGGFSLGLESTGHFRTVAFCEIDKFCKLILDKHWKGTKVYDDIKTITKKQFEEDGYGKFPICIAKTQYSFSTDPGLKGAPTNHSIPIREVRLSSGAEFIVVVCGEIMTMPGLPSIPAANSIKLNDDGEIEGLF